MQNGITDTKYSTSTPNTLQRAYFVEVFCRDCQLPQFASCWYPWAQCWSPPPSSFTSIMKNHLWAQRPHELSRQHPAVHTPAAAPALSAHRCLQQGCDNFHICNFSISRLTRQICRNFTTKTKHLFRKGPRNKVMLGTSLQPVAYSG